MAFTTALLGGLGSLASAGAGAVGSLVSGVGSVVGGVASKALTPGGLAIGSQLFGGLSGKGAASEEANLLREQGNLELQQSYDEASRRAREIKQFQMKQKLAFLKNGVRLEGSPLLVLDETASEGNKELDSIKKQGQAYYNLRQLQAKKVSNTGRSSLLSGFGDAYGAYQTGKYYGIFG